MNVKDEAELFAFDVPTSRGKFRIIGPDTLPPDEAERVAATIARVLPLAVNAPDDAIVQVGQLWGDNDQRAKSRGDRQHLRIVSIDGEKAVINNEDTGLVTRIRLDRLKPTSTGYYLKEPVTPESSR